MLRSTLFILLLVVLCTASNMSEVFVGMVMGVGYVPYEGDVQGTSMVFTTSATFVVFGTVRYKAGDGAWFVTDEHNCLYLYIQNRVNYGPIRKFRLTKGN